MVGVTLWFGSGGDRGYKIGVWFFSRFSLVACHGGQYEGHMHLGGRHRLAD